MLIGPASIFSRAEEKEEGNDRHVSRGLQGSIKGVRGGNAKGMVQDADRDRLDPGGGRVVLSIGAELSL